MTTEKTEKSVHLAELLSQAYQETLQSFSEEEQQALTSAVPQDTLIASIMQHQDTPAASEDVQSLKEELAALETQVADMAAKLTKYRAEVPASLQTCITAVLAHDAAALATHADIDKENATMHNGANSPVAMLPETLPDEMREACRRLPVLRSELQVTYDRLARVLQVVEVDTQRPPPNTVDRYVNQRGRVSDARSPGDTRELAGLRRALASEVQT